MTRVRIRDANYVRPKTFLMNNIGVLLVGVLDNHQINHLISVRLAFYIKNTIDEKLYEAS